MASNIRKLDTPNVVGTFILEADIKDRLRVLLRSQCVSVEKTLKGGGDPNWQVYYALYGMVTELDGLPKVSIDKGPWHVGHDPNEAWPGKDKYFVESDDFHHDVRLYLDGDFADEDEKQKYMDGIARQLNTTLKEDNE